MATSPDLLEEQTAIDQFQVSLEVFEGPFDLLLQLIARKKLDITQVALSEVTDEFIAHMKAFPDLSRTTEFLVVAATLLDMKAASLLPRPEGEEDISREDLEARDLLFSRLLQYRAFKLAGRVLGERLLDNAGRFPRAVPLEAHFAQLLPELRWTWIADDLARACAAALSQQPPTVQITHLHDPVVPVATQALLVMNALRERGAMTFHELVADADTTAVVVSRFLALLELYRRQAVEFLQEEPLAPLTIQWSGNDDPDRAQWDDYSGSSPLA